MLRRSLLSLLVLCSVSCGDQPDPGFLLVKARVLGNTLSVQGDASRTTPRPGETIDVEWILTAPDALEPTAWVFIVCEAAPGAFGIDFCAGEPIALASNMSPSTDAPRFEVEVPESYTAASLLILGSVCMGGNVSIDIDPSDPESAANPCVDEGVGQIVTTNIPIQLSDADANIAPGIAGITFDGEPWTTELEGDRGACAGMGMPEVRFGSTDDHVIGLDAVEGSRETYRREIFGEQQDDLEDLQNSVFSSEEGLERQFAFIDDINPRVELDYTAEELEDAPPADGRTIRFEFVMRDGRGGVDHESRAACLLP